MSPSSTLEKVVMVEGAEDVKRFDEKGIFSSNTSVVSFDFNAHKKLTELGIDHKIIEKYFSVEDQDLIDNKTIDLVLNWYKLVDPQKKLVLNGLEIGNLIEIEITNYFFLMLKRIVGIINFITKENPKEIICGKLGAYLEKLAGNIKITKYDNKESTADLYFDKIEIPLTIRNKTKSLKISRSKYMKIKHFTEGITDKFLNSDVDFDDKKNNVLFLDFNPIQYSELFNEMKNSNYEIILLNQRRPAIWNKESFGIVRKNSCKILKLEKLKNPNISKEIVTITDELLKNIENMFSRKIENEFIIKNQEFWSIIRDELKIIVKRKTQEIVEKIILIEELFQKLKVRCVVDWAHTGVEEKIVNYFAAKNKIPIISLQHAIYPLNQKWDKYHPIYPHIPSKETKEAVWGSMLKEYVLNQGLSENQILLSGSPRHDPFFRKKTSFERKNTVLIAANLFVHFNFAGNDTLAYERLERYVKKIIQIMKKNNKKIIVKLHPSQSYHDIKSVIEKIDSNIPIFQNQNLLELIDSCETLISLNYSTILLDAMTLNKPTMVILAEHQEFEKEEMIKQGATLAVENEKELENKSQLLFDDKYRNKLIKNGKEFVNQYFINQGNASRNFVKLMDDVIKRK